MAAIIHKILAASFARLTDSKKIFRIHFVCIQYHLCEISCQIIECKFILVHMNSITDCSVVWTPTLRTMPILVSAGYV